LQFLFNLIYFLILSFYLERKTTSRRAGFSAIAEFLVLT